MELGRSNLTYRCPQTRTRTPCRKMFFGVAGEDSAPNSIFSELSELSETSQSRKLIFGLPDNIE